MQLSIPKFELLNGVGDDDVSSLARNGYLIIKKPFAEELIDEASRWTRERFFDSTGKVLSVRAQDEWRNSPAVKELACNTFIMEKLEALYGRKPIPFQTLNFPIGTVQNTHSDTVHFHSFPQRWMCGVWVALEDISAECGPLHYYPGSHRLPVLTMEDVGVNLAFEFKDINRTRGQKVYEKYELAIKELLEIAGIEKETLCIEKGDLLIWTANLLHGGEPILKEGATRLSQVTHYYFEGCRYYTPLISDFCRSDITFRNNIKSIADS